VLPLIYRSHAETDRPQSTFSGRGAMSAMRPNPANDAAQLSPTGPVDSGGTVR
jgi:hypothetical protein